MSRARTVGVWAAILLVAFLLLAFALAQRVSHGPARHLPTAERSPAHLDSRVLDLKEVNYYPADGGWTYMWSHFHPAVINRDFARIRALNANTVRIFVQPSVFGFPAVNPVMANRLSEVIGLAARHSLRVHLTLFDLWSQFTDIQGSKEWASSLLSRYRDDPRIAVVELHNEIKPQDPAAVAWVTAMLPYLYTILPSTLRTVSTANVPPGEFALFTRELKNSPPDFWDYHYYGPAADAYPRLSTIKALAAPRPLFIGETGYSTDRTPGDQAAQDQAQAAYYRALFTATAALSLPTPAPWTLNDFFQGGIPPGRTADEPAAYGYGLFQVDGIPKPAAAVVSRAFSGKLSTMAADGTDQRRPELKLCVVGSGTRFVSGISYYTYFLGCALKQRYDVVAILMRHLIPRRWYPGRQRVGHSVMAYDLAAEVPAFDGVDWWGWPSVPRALSFLRTHRPHVLILQWWSSSVLPWYLLMARQVVRRGNVVVVELHEDLDTGEARIPLLGWLARRGLKTLCRQAAMLVVHSTWDRDRMAASLGIDPGQFRVIPHGPYQISGAAPREATGPPQARPLREPSELTVLFFGTIRPYKGLEHLIGAFEQLRRALAVPWKLVVVGETWEGWTLPVELIESSPYRDDIELVNRYVTDQEAAGYFRRADVVALPYLRSSASGPLAIAQACGLPVVITEVGGLVEAVADYTGAVLVQPGSPDDLARGLLAAADLRGRMHSAPVTWQAVAESYTDIFAAAAPPAVPGG